MKYKVIKNMSYGTMVNYNGIFEMSQDGRSIRKIGSNSQIKFNPEGSVTLRLDDSSTRDFGIKTLYRFSWHKPLPYEVEGAAVKKRKTSAEKEALAKIKAERAKRREIRSALKVKKGSLVSKINRERLAHTMKRTKKLGNAVFEITDKRVFIRTLLAEGPVILLRQETQSLRRTGLFFLNVDNGNFVRFDAKIHKPGYGDKSIIWPKLS